MKATAVLCVLVAACALACVTATGSSAVLAPTSALESFLESGSHTQAEIDAMAEAEVAAVMGASSSTDSEADLVAAAEAGIEASAASEVEAEGDMPRDKLQQKRDHRRRLAAKKAAAAAAKAARPPTPPKHAFNPVAAAAAGMPDGSDRDDIIKLVYDELKRLGSVAGTQPASTVGGASTPSPLGISDPRIQTLEHRLHSFEKQRTEQANKAQDHAIAGITARLEGLDKTLAALRKSAEQQQALSAQLLRASKTAQQKADETPIDYSVSYEKATLPADFDKKVESILGSVKTEARKIYERYCKRFGKTPKPEPATSDKSSGPKPKPGTPAAAIAAARAASQSIGNESSPADSMAAADMEHARVPSRAVRAGKPKKILFKPITTGKEPTPEGMRLSKALNDVAIALPVTPAYQLGRKQQALHDVLGESAVNPKFKTPRL